MLINKYLRIVFIFIIAFSFMPASAGVISSTPCPPENLHTTNARSDGFVDLEWDSPSRSGNCIYSGAATLRTYNVFLNEYDSNGKSLGKKLVAQPGTGGEYVLSLKPNIKYDAFVSVEYSDGAISQEASLPNIFIAGNAGSNICSVSSLSASHVNSDPDNVITVSWNESCPTGAQKPSSYGIYLNFSTFSKEVSSSASSQYNIKLSLDKGTYYQINVYPKYTNTPDSTKYGASTSVTTPGVKENVNGFLQKNQLNLHVTDKRVPSGGIVLAWNSVTDTNSVHAISTYSLKYAEYDQNSNLKQEVLQTTLFPPVTSYFLSSLKSGVKYAIILRGYNASNELVSEDTITDVFFPNFISTTVSTPVVTTTKISNQYSNLTDVTKYVLQIAQQNILLRGYVQSIQGDVLSVRTFGGVWKVVLSPVTEYIGKDKARPVINIGDFIGAKGRISSTEDYTFTADAFRNRTLYP